MKVKDCSQCEFCKIYPDPDPKDWFCDDDVKMICTHKDSGEYKEGEVNKFFFEHAEKSKKLGRLISGAMRPYEVNKGEYIPDWCPLNKNN